MRWSEPVSSVDGPFGSGPGERPPDGQPNRRNGAGQKALGTIDGPLTVEIPRDRARDFEPRVVPNRARQVRRSLLLQEQMRTNHFSGIRLQSGVSSCADVEDPGNSSGRC